MVRAGVVAWGWGWAWLAVAGAARGEEAPSFVNDVVPVLTRLGCNAGACHGKLAGQNGFKLSLRGYAPELDHIAITRDARGRRIAKGRPRESLLLTKPLLIVPHKGGHRLTVGTPEYQTLLAWIAAGAPGPAKAEPEVTAVVVEPSSATYRPEGSRALKVLAVDCCGLRRDVTRLALFKSNEEGLARVDEDGKVTALRPGATAIMASFQGQVAVHVVTTPYDQQVDPALFAERSNRIDDHVMEMLRAMRLPPSPRCDDRTFLRRVSLDLTGTLPDPDAVLAFEADPSPSKRAALVDRLLESEAYVDSWAASWGELMQNRLERDGDRRGRKGVRSFAHWLREQVRADRPWDEVVRDVLTARGPLSQEPAGGYYLVNRRPEDLAEATAHAFLGVRIQCAKCHNHPLERYTQDDYYGMAAFFSRVKLDGKPNDEGPAVDVGVPARRGRRKGASTDARQVGITQPRTGQFLRPRPLDRSSVELEDGQDPRAVLAAWMTAPGNRTFARAVVNRLWRRFFAVGLVEPVDDLRATNPASNEPLLDALADELVKNHYHLKPIIRLILDSRTYGLASDPLPGKRGRPAVLLALLPPAPTGRSPGRRREPGDGRARAVRGLRAGPEGVATARPEGPQLPAGHLRPTRARDAVCLRAVVGGHDAAGPPPTQRRGPRPSPDRRRRPARGAVALGQVRRRGRRSTLPGDPRAPADRCPAPGGRRGPRRRRTRRPRGGLPRPPLGPPQLEGVPLRPLIDRRGLDGTPFGTACAEGCGSPRRKGCAGPRSSGECATKNQGTVGFSAPVV
ncbi:MAG TPA: DUF1549 domain-containing protein [Isosphaeraceae bacterium]|nr:DUF1549 domain-containing protein [Isosphaeraceae bacterium]